MKKYIILLSLLFVSAAGMVYAHEPSQERLQAYQALEQQRQELLNWSRTHFYATYWGKAKRKNEAKSLRQQQYEEFKDVELWKIQSKQKNLKGLNASLTTPLPYVEQNLFPEANLDKLAKDNVAVLQTLLELYPENILHIDAAYLLDLMRKSELFSAYVANYEKYVKNYFINEKCIENMTDYYKGLVTQAQEQHQPEKLMAALANGCADYVAKQGQEKVLRADLQRALQQDDLTSF